MNKLEYIFSKNNLVLKVKNENIMTDYIGLDILKIGIFSKTNSLHIFFNNTANTHNLTGIKEEQINEFMSQFEKHIDKFLKPSINFEG